MRPFFVISVTFNEKIVDYEDGDFSHPDAAFIDHRIYAAGGTPLSVSAARLSPVLY